MTAIAFQLLVLLAGAIIVLAPGLPLMLAFRLPQGLHPALLPAACVALGVIPMAAITAVSLWLHRPVIYVIAGIVAWILVGTAIVVMTGRAGGLRTWLAVIPRSVWITLLVIGTATFITGAPIASDALYHAAQALKLGHLAHPSFGNTLMFRTGDAHPGYYIPVWQEYIALISRTTGAHPTTVLMVMPSFIAMLVALTAGGCFATLAPSARHALPIGTIVGALTLVRVTGDGVFAPAFYPSPIVVRIILPLALACWFCAVWSDRHVTRVVGNVTLAACAICILVIHISYVALLALMLIATGVMWLILGSDRKRLALRHARTACMLLGIGGIWITLLTPVLNRLGSTPGSSKAALQRFDHVLTGDVRPNGHFHLDPARLLHHDHTLLALSAALAVIPIILFRSREFIAWHVAGTTLATLAIAESSMAFPILVSQVSAPQAVRIGLLLPTMLAASMATQMLIDLAQSRKITLRSTPGMLLVAGFACAGGAYWLLSHGNVIKIENLVHSTNLWLIGVATIVMAATHAIRRRATPQPERAVAGIAAGMNEHAHAVATSKSSDDDVQLTDRLSSPVKLIAICALALMLPTAVSSATHVGKAAHARPSSGTKADTLARFDADIRDELQRTAPGEVLLASPYDSFDAMALAPLYVVGSAIWHVPDTPANKRIHRSKLARRFFADHMTDQRRAAIIAGQGVRWILIPVSPDRHDNAAHHFVTTWSPESSASTPLMVPARLKRTWPTSFTLVTRGKHHSLFRVNRGST